MPWLRSRLIGLADVRADLNVDHAAVPFSRFIAVVRGLRSNTVHFRDLLRHFLLQCCLVARRQRAASGLPASERIVCRLA